MVISEDPVSRRVVVLWPTDSFLHSFMTCNIHAGALRQLIVFSTNSLQHAIVGEKPRDLEGVFGSTSAFCQTFLRIYNHYIWILINIIVTVVCFNVRPCLPKYRPFAPGHKDIHKKRDRKT